MSNGSPSRDPGEGVAGDVADGVAAALARGQAGVGELADQLRGVGQRDVVDLDVLAGGDVALVERRVLLDHAREGLHLLGGDAAHRQLHPDHLHVGLALAVDALLEPEADELVLGRLAARNSPPRCRSRRTRARGSGSRGPGRSRRPRGSRASRASPCPSGPCGSTSSLCSAAIRSLAGRLAAARRLHAPAEYINPDRVLGYLSLGQACDSGLRRAPTRGSAQSTSVPSIRNATRTWARYSSRFSPRIPVETMSTARMLRSELCACCQRLLRGVVGRRLRAADQLDDLHYGHCSPPRLGRSGLWGVLSDGA